MHRTSHVCEGAFAVPALRSFKLNNSLALLAFFVLFVVPVLAGCKGGALAEPEESMSPPTPRRELPGLESAVPLAFETRVRTHLDCANPAAPTQPEAGTCRHWFRLEVPQRSELRIAVDALSGPDVPDFDVRLEDAAGGVLWGDAPTGYAPREIRRIVAADTYYVVVDAVGEIGGRLALELSVDAVEVGAPSFSASQFAAGARQRAQLRRGVAAPIVKGPEAWMSAEIVAVEGQAERPAFVVIDAGTADGLRVGLLGEAFESGVRIGVFELVVVGEAESRGRFERAPLAAVTIDTEARIRVPLGDGD